MIPLDGKSQQETSPQVAVLVLHYKNIQLTIDCVQSIQKNEYPATTLHVVENGSEDPIPEKFFSDNPLIKRIYFEDNLGFARAYNQAIETVEEKYIAILNNDTIVDPDWLTHLITPLLNNNNIAFTGSLLLFANPPDTINHAGGYFSSIGMGIDRSLGQRTEKSPCNNEITAFTCGAAMAFKKSVFQELGRFDPDYFAYYEDVDICWRAWLAGYTVLHVPRSIVRHYHSAATSWESPLKIRCCHRNKYYNIIKNREFFPLLYSLCVAFGYDIMKMLLFLKSMRFDAIKSLALGYADVLGGIGNLMGKRIQIQKSRTIGDGELKSKGIFMGGFAIVREFFRQRKFLNTSDEDQRGEMLVE